MSPLPGDLSRGPCGGHLSTEESDDVFFTEKTRAQMLLWKKVHIKKVGIPHEN